MSETVLRTAVADDSKAISDLLWSSPSGEAAALAGSVERARHFGKLLEDASAAPTWTHCVVAEHQGEVCGLVQQGPAEEEFAVTSRFVLSIVRAWGLFPTLRLLPRAVALQRVRIAAPSRSWVVRELHVSPGLRGRGIGGLLLSRAEQDGKSRSRTTIALTTRTNNPARRLYERNGYQVVDERVNRSYRKLTGAEGRILMTKRVL